MTTLNSLLPDVLGRVEDPMPPGPIFWNLTDEVYPAMVEAEFEAALITGVVQANNVVVTLAANTTYFPIQGSSSVVAAGMLDGYYSRPYTNANVAKKVGPESYYHMYMKEIAGIKRARGNVNTFAELGKKYGKSVQVEQVKKKISDAKDELLRRYPMLKYINIQSHSVSDVAEYIMMVDKQG